MTTAAARIPGRARRAPRVLAALLALAAVLVASWTLWPLYQTQRFPLVIVSAAALGAVVGVWTAWRRPPVVVAAVVAAALHLLLADPLAMPDGAVLGILPAPDALARAATADITGWKGLLTLRPPVGAYDALLVPAHLLVTAASAVAVGGAAGGRTHRRSATAAAGAAPAALLLVGTALTGTAPDAGLALGSVLLVVLAVVVRRPARVEDGEPVLRRVSGAARRTSAALVVVAVAAALGTAALVVLPADPGPRASLRDVVQPPFDPRSEDSPLSAFRWFHTAPTDTEELLVATGLEPGDRIRLATLDAWDGRVAGYDGARFERLPSALAPVGGGAEVRSDMRVTGLAALGAVWVPTTGELVDVDLGDRSEDIVVDVDTGTVALPEPLPAGASLVVTARRSPLADAAALVDAAPAGTASFARVAPPEAVDGFLAASAPLGASAGERLVAAVERLRAEGFVSHGTGDDPASRPGHSAERIAALLSSSPMIGDAEQYAVAAALIADRLGFEARVVVGFDSVVDAAGTARATGQDATAWIEVRTAADGWTQLDATPDERPAPATGDRQPEDVARPRTVLPPDTAAAPPVAQQPGALGDERAPVPASDNAVLRTVVAVAGWTLLVAGVLLGPAVVALLLKRRRARRRAAGEPGERVEGAWREFVDAAVDAGGTPPPSATRRETARALAPAAEGRRAAALAGAADRARYGPDAVDDPLAERAAADLAALRAALAAGAPPGVRLLRAVSPRSLLRPRLQALGVRIRHTAGDEQRRRDRGSRRGRRDALVRGRAEPPAGR